jgi:hypothetical protein
MYLIIKFLIYNHQLILENAWTISSTSNPGRSIINGNFSGELDLPSQDNTDITNRIDQLEKEVKGRDAEIRELNERVNFFFFILLLKLMICFSL